MKAPRGKIRFNRLMVGVLAMVSMVIFFAIGCFVVVREYVEYTDESSRMKNDYLATRREMLKNEVNRAIDFINYSRSDTEKRLEESIKTRVYEAHAIATHLYRKHAVIKSESEVLAIILDALRPVRFNNGRGYYFATGFDGVEILFADRPEFEGKSLSDMRDAEGAFVIRDMIGIVKQDGEGFYRYAWTKPGMEGRTFPKTAYIKYFEPFDMFIGTGEYVDDVKQDVQREVLERIGKIRFGRDGYIFVVGFDGATLMNGVQPELIGQNHWELSDPNGLKVIQEERKAAEKPEGDFIHYLWEKSSTGRIAPKMSFVRGIPEWRWMVGAGIYMDEIESAMAEKETEMWHRIKNEFLILGAAFSLFFFVIVLLSAFAARHFQKGVDAFLSFFREMKHGGAPIDITRLRLHEFALLAESANEMLAAGNRTEAYLKESETRYRALFDQSLDCIYLHDLEGNFIDANESALKLLGYSRDEIRSLNIRNVISKDQLDHVIGETRKFTQTGRQRKPLELRVKRRDGHTVYVEINASIIHDSRGPYAIQGIARDVTDRKGMEGAVLEERERLEAILSAQNTGLSVIDPDMRIAWVSRKIREMFPGSEPVGRNCHECYESRESVCDGCGSVLAFQSGFSIEKERLNPVNNRWYHVLSLPIKDDRGNITHVIEGITDVTDQKKTETERAELEQQLIQAQRLESVGRLAGGVAHDFNNMLSVISGYSEMALDQLDPSDPLREDIGEILTSARRSADLTRQLLAFARRQPLEMKPLDINRTIEGIMKLVRRTVKENIIVDFHLAPALPAINADVGQIEQCIMKLAVNAQEAMPAGGKLVVETSAFHKSVSMDTRPDFPPGAYVEVKISDNGVGMSDDVRERIFEPFFTTKEMGSGSGLGLAVIHGIIKQHGGYISVASEPGKGTTFRLFFPVGKENGIKADETEPDGKSEGSETILLVEDEEQVRGMASRILRHYGYKVLEAGDGKSAIDIALKHPNLIDLLITDVIMPNLNGKDVFNALAKIQPGIKVLFISGYAENIIGGLLEENIPFLQKPFAKSDFVKKVRWVLDMFAEPISAVSRTGI